MACLLSTGWPMAARKLKYPKSNLRNTRKLNLGVGSKLNQNKRGSGPAAAAPKDAGMSAEEGWGYNPKQAGIIPKSLGG